MGLGLVMPLLSWYEGEMRGGGCIGPVGAAPWGDWTAFARGGPVVRGDSKGDSDLKVRAGGKSTCMFVGREEPVEETVFMWLNDLDGQGGGGFFGASPESSSGSVERSFGCSMDN